MKIAFFLILTGCSFLSQAQKNFDVLHYNYNLELSDKSDTIKGIATIRIKAIEPISNFDLDLSGEKNGKGMSVQSVVQKSNNSDKINFTLSNDKLSIVFANPRRPGCQGDPQGLTRHAQLWNMGLCGCT